MQNNLHLSKPILGTGIVHLILCFPFQVMDSLLVTHPAWAIHLLVGGTLGGMEDLLLHPQELTLPCGTGLLLLIETGQVK